MNCDVKICKKKQSGFHIIKKNGQGVKQDGR